ncbi:methyltransferase domain-containing protein [soil metagenome]
MSELERVEWDRRYAEGDYRPRRDPSPFLEAWLGTVTPGLALDVACGTGRNALRLAEAGFDVRAVDISAVATDMGRKEAVARGLSLDWEVADLDRLDLTDRSFQLITVFRYVNRPLWPRLVAALAPGGWLLVEHHLQTHLSVDGPSTPDFRLAPQELLAAFSDLRIVSYMEGPEEGDREGSTFVIARLAACNGDPGW